jgi:hypothetical protein
LSKWKAHLDVLIDNAVYDSQSIEVKMNALGLALGDQLVLLVEVVEELYCLSL